jgi:hypothetical protein
MPLPNCVPGGASLAAASLPGNSERINGRVELGAAMLDAGAEEACCACTTTGAGGFGSRGVTTFGASTGNGIRSGCSKGSIIATPTTATCKPIDASIVHRLLEET